MTGFPKDFFWGAAGAAYQVEGGIENCDWAEAARKGRVPICGQATDHYNRYESDFDIAKSLGHNAHRFSIEWARIEPEEGKFDEKEIEHYREVIRALRDRGLEPFVTLWHFTLPIWFAKKGGFQNKEAPEIFARYCTHVVEKLGDEAKYWITINEPLVWSSGGYRTGKWPPFKKNLLSFLGVQNSLAKAHNLAFLEMKKRNTNIEVGIAKNNIAFLSNGSMWANGVASFMNWFWNERFLNKISSHQDFMGLNHYFYKKFGSREKFPQSDMGWDIVPVSIYHTLLKLKKYNKPIYITENGLADASDEKRQSFIADYTYEVSKAIGMGVDVRGYFYWSLLDNFEWSYGFTRRFGLVEVDYSTLERKVRKSALVYKEIIEKSKV